MHPPPLAPALVDELRNVSDNWLAARQTRERRFASGWFDDDYVRTSRVAAVHAPDGAITALANLLPEYHLCEVTVDLMRRLGDAEPGTLEFLVTWLFDWSRAQGYSTFNLGLIPLAGVGQAPAVSAPERVMHYIYRQFNLVYNFHGIYEFKAKFHPKWSPRYLQYRGATSLPAVWVGVLRAHTGDHNFLRGWRTWQGG